MRRKYLTLLFLSVCLSMVTVVGVACKDTDKDSLLISEKVDAISWTAAIEATYNADNLTVEVGTVTDFADNPEFTTTANGTMKVADNKMYTELNYDDETMYVYTGNMDGMLYQWSSVDGIEWNTQCIGDAVAINGAWCMQDEDWMPEKMTFDTVVFNESEGGYQYIINETDYAVIGFKEGKISFLKRVGKGGIAGSDGNIIKGKITRTFVLTYGNASVGELPFVQ